MTPYRFFFFFFFFGWTCTVDVDDRARLEAGVSAVAFLFFLRLFGAWYKALNPRLSEKKAFFLFSATVYLLAPQIASIKSNVILLAGTC